MVKVKKFTAKNNYDVAVECTACGAAISETMLEPVSKDKLRCPWCKAIFTPKPEHIRGEFQILGRK